MNYILTDKLTHEEFNDFCVGGSYKGESSVFETEVFLKSINRLYPFDHLASTTGKIVKGIPHIQVTLDPEQ